MNRRLDDKFWENFFTGLFLYVQVPAVLTGLVFGLIFYAAGVEHGNEVLEAAGVWTMTGGFVLFFSTIFGYGAFLVLQGALRLAGRLARAMERL